jgi:ABC-2 type transport system permease protein
MARPWYVIARREFVERVRSKWFVVVTVLGPLLMAGVVLVPAWIGKQAADEDVKVQVVDRSGHGFTALIAASSPMLDGHLQVKEVPPGTPEEVLRSRIQAKAIQGYLVIDPDVLASGRVVYRGDNASNFGFRIKLNQILNAAVIGERARVAGLEAAQIVDLLRPIDLDMMHTTGEGAAKSATQSYVVGIVVMMVLYMAILLYAVNVMRSVVQEKTSRVVEIVVSSTRPSSLMLGKVLGVGVVGLLQLGIWAGVALLLVHFRGGLLAVLGVSTGGPPLVDLSIGDVALILVYFVFGYFFYAAIYAGLGAMVNSDQEAQQVQMPVALLLIGSVAMVQIVVNDPRGVGAEILTYLPFSSPVLMPMRWTLDGASISEVAVSLSILALVTFALVRLAARVYRVGILMYGKRPSLGELGRWLRHG